MNQPNISRKYERPQRQVPYIPCDVYVTPDGNADELKDAGSQIYALSINARLGGVDYDGALLKRLFDGIPLPTLIPGTDPEPQPITLYIRKDYIAEYSLSVILKCSLTSRLFTDIRLNGRSILLDVDSPLDSMGRRFR